VIVTCIYAYVSLEQLLLGNRGLALMWGGYSVANIGVLIVMRGQ
jgi:hypothetical protein